MIPTVITSAVQTYGPSVIKAGANYLFEKGVNQLASAMPALEGNAVGGTFNANPVMGGLNDSQLMQNPGQMATQQQQLMRSQQLYENQMGQGNTAYNAGVGNAVANVAVQRQMVRDAQLQQAQIAQTMMNNLSSNFGNTLGQSTLGMAEVLSAIEPTTGGSGSRR